MTADPTTELQHRFLAMHWGIDEVHRRAKFTPDIRPYAADADPSLIGLDVLPVADSAASRRIAVLQEKRIESDILWHVQVTLKQTTGREAPEGVSSSQRTACHLPPAHTLLTVIAATEIFCRPEQPIALQVPRAPSALLTRKYWTPRT